MKQETYLKLSRYAYYVIAFCLLLVLLLWTRLFHKPLDGTVIVIGMLLACICIFLGYRVLKVGSDSFKARRKFAIHAGIFCGSLMALGGWFAGIVFGVPLLIALLGMPDMWKQHKKEQEKV